MRPQTARVGFTLGAPPLTPRQEPEVPGPPGFYSKPCNPACSSALRANIARFFVRPQAARVGFTLGAPPLTPRQKPEVPGPPGFYSKPCSPACSSALRTFHFCLSLPYSSTTCTFSLPNVSNTFFNTSCASALGFLTSVSIASSTVTGFPAACDSACAIC